MNPPSFSDDEVSTLLSELGQPLETYAANRRRRQLHLAVLLMLDAGLRVKEATLLTWDDCYFQAQPVPHLAIRREIAKRSNPRSIPVSPRLSAMLASYWTQTEAIRTVQHPAFLLIGPDPLRPIATRSIERQFKVVCSEVLHRNGWPHMCRHTFANRLKSKTDLRTLQVLLGHKHLSSTEVYLHPDDDDKRKAIDALPQEPASAI